MMLNTCSTAQMVMQITQFQVNPANVTPAILPFADYIYYHNKSTRTLYIGKIHTALVYTLIIRFHSV